MSRAGMIVGKVERGEVVVVRLDLRTFGDREPQSLEDLDDLVLHAGDGMRRAGSAAAPREREVEPLAPSARGRARRASGPPPSPRSGPRSRAWPGSPPGRLEDARRREWLPSERSSPVSSPERPSTRTRTCSIRSWSGPRRSPPGPGRGSPGPAGPPRAPSYARWARTVSASFAKAVGSETASSARILRSRPIPAFLSPFMNVEYESPSLTACRVDADDPERARPPLLLLAPLVGERAGAQHGLGGGAIELAPSSEVPLRLLEHLLPALAGLGPALGPWHVTVSLAELKIRDQAIRAVADPPSRPARPSGAAACAWATSTRACDASTRCGA